MATTLAELRDELLAAISASIAANKNPGEGKISFLADVQNALAAGGGGGGGTVNAPTYFDYEVQTAHNSLTVGQIIREIIGAGGARTWSLPGGGALPGGDPNPDNLELAGFSGLAAQLATGFTSVTGNQATIISLLSRNLPCKLVSQTATAGSAVTLLIVAPPADQRHVLTYINAGYHGAAFPANGAGVLSVDMGVDTLVFPGITSVGPAPVYQADSGLQADLNQPVTLVLPSIPNLIPTITVAYRTGA